MLSPSAHVTTSSSINCLFSLFQQDEANIRLNAALGEIQTVRAYFSYARVVPRAQTIKNERDAGQDDFRIVPWSSAAHTSTTCGDIPELDE